MKFLVRFIVMFYCMQLFSMAPAFALEFDLSSGIDSNPFRLSDSLNPVSEGFVRFKAAHEQDIGRGFYGQLKGDFHRYTNENADTSRLSAAAGWQYKINAQHRLKLDAKLGFYDKNYISRFTGQTATSGGIPIGDRYDNVWQQLTMEYQYRVNKKHRFYFQGYWQNKNYDDFAELELSDRDFHQYQLATRWRYRINKAWQWQLGYQYRYRDYLNREAADLLGDPIEEIALAYNYNAFFSELRWRANESHQLSLRVKQDKKTDNASGYYNTQYNRLTARWRWLFSKKEYFDFRWSYLDYQSDREPPEEDLDELDSIDNSGNKLSMKYRQRLFNSKRWFWIIQFEYHDFAAKNPVYSYQRQLTYLGLEASW